MLATLLPAVFGVALASPGQEALREFRESQRSASSVFDCGPSRWSWYYAQRPELGAGVGLDAGAPRVNARLAYQPCNALSLAAVGAIEPLPEGQGGPRRWEGAALAEWRPIRGKATSSLTPRAIAYFDLGAAIGPAVSWADGVEPAAVAGPILRVGLASEWLLWGQALWRWESVAQAPQPTGAVGVSWSPEPPPLVP